MRIPTHGTSESIISRWLERPCSRRGDKHFWFLPASSRKGDRTDREVRGGLMKKCRAGGCEPGWDSECIAGEANNPHSSCFRSGVLKTPITSENKDLHYSFSLIRRILQSGQSITEETMFTLLQPPYRRGDCLKVLRRYHQCYPKVCDLVLRNGLWTLEPVGGDQ